MFKMKFVLYVITACIVGVIKCKDTQVTIPDGILQGLEMVDYDGGKFYGFTKVPFARPPLGEYRFKIAEKNEPWKGILDATQPSPACTQPNVHNTALIGQEDCLYLNIFTNTTKPSVLKSVIIYVHGGTFLQGTSSEYGPEFLMTQDIVLVTINYRLGVYGFLNTLNSKIAKNDQMFGNNGFKDQVLAFKWVQKNIQYFGGDPERVTISGESAGAMAVHAHMLSPLSIGLFHQVIAMSGSAILPELQTANNTATPLAKYLGLNITNYDVMIQELRNTSNEDLFMAAKALKWFDIQLNNPCLTGLVIEKPGKNSFITDYPWKILKSGKYNQVPLMIGNNNREGLLIYGLWEIQPNLKELETSIPFLLSNKSVVIKKVREFYNLDSLEEPLNLIDFYTDIWFQYHIFRAAREQAEITSNGNVYFYQFAGDGNLNYLKSQLPIITNMHGANHADELGYLFKTAGAPRVGSLEEQLMRNTVKMWTNFVINGKPLENLEQFRNNAHHYVNITNSGFELGVLNEKSFKFWDEIYRDYADSLY